MDRSKDFWVGRLFKIGFHAVHDSCCAVASSLDFYVGKKRHVNFSVALLHRKYFGSEDCSKLDRCVLRFLLPCWVLPRNLGMRKRACEYQCCVVASEVIWIGRLSKIWYMRFKIPVALLRRPQKFR